MSHGAKETPIHISRTGTQENTVKSGLQWYSTWNGLSKDVYPISIRQSQPLADQCNASCLTSSQWCWRVAGGPATWPASRDTIMSQVTGPGHRFVPRTSDVTEETDAVTDA